MNKRLYDVLNGKEENYMLPFYWQHGDHYEKIPEQVELIYQSGCRALCVESRPHNDFCGPGWWRDMDLIISECEKRGMKVWILDDDHYPTGHANGAVKNHPELRKWNFIERHVDVAGPLNGALLTVEPENKDNILLGVYAYRRTGNDEDCLPEPVDLRGGLSDKFLRFSLPEGCYRIFFLYKSRRGSGRNDYIDMLREESVKLLIDAVYEPHYERYGRYFGNTVAGFFSDEPSFGNTWFGAHTGERVYDTMVGMPGLALPYNERVIDMMRDALGADPLPLLPALWFGMGEKTGDVRHAYMDAVTKLYRDCFTRQLGDWCEAHNVEYIGHIIEDMNSHARLGWSSGHYYRSLDGQHMSGVDIVLHQIIPGMSHYIHTAITAGNRADPEFFDYVLAKLASSFAHIGTQMKGRAMCEVFGAFGWAEGAPMMKWLLDHLLVRGVNYFVPHAFSTMFPDPDCPPHFGIEGLDPQFEGFAKLMNYGNKAAHLLSSGTHKADAAILYHADAEWYNGEAGSMYTQIPAKILYDEHIDYDILPADCFVEAGSRVYRAEAENGKLKVGSETYGCLIVPAAVKLPEKLEEALADMENKGVRVIRMGFDTEADELIAEVDKSTERDIEVEGGYPLLRCTHYEDGDADIYMFVNESVSEHVRTTVGLRSVKGAKACVLLDMLNDSVYKVKTANGRLPLDLAPYQSVIAVFDRSDGFEGVEEKRAPVRAEKAKLSFKIELAPYTDMNGYELYAENVPSDRLPDITDIKNKPDFSGRIKYTCKFNAREGVRGIDLGEVGQVSHLYCNGKDCGVRICPPYSYDLTDALKAGENELIIEVSNTLANAVRDGFSAFLAIPRSGLFGEIRWMK